MRPQVEVSALPVSGRPYDRWRIDITCVKSAVRRRIGITYVRSTVRPLAYRHYLCQVGRTTVGDSALLVPGRPYDHWGFGLTCARSAARLLAPSYLRPTSFLRWVDHVDGPVVRRSDDVASRSLCVISFFPPGEDLLEVPDEGAEDEVLCLALGNLNGARVNPIEQELRNCDVARVDPTEQELGNCDVARADPTEQELGNWDVARVDPTEQELGNCDVARVDPTEQELGNCDSDFRQGHTWAQTLGFGRGGELGRKYGDLAKRVNSGVNLEIWPRR
ncbi:hypothetical protein GW17_00023253 [Ensete ventricosum]|nr:hypothetical protein GW17_00023253 [Ensete ventricosum]